MSPVPHPAPAAPLIASPAGDDPLRVAIAHEWLVKYAGSERCVVELRREFPGARLLTTVTGSDEDLPAELHQAEPSLLQRIPGAAPMYQWLVPAMPLAWAARRTVDDVDLVISSSHACAKSVRIADGIPHLCYCHTPMRYAWDFESEKARFPRGVRPLARASALGLRHWDRRSAHHVTRFVANSTAVAERIRNSYGRDADVVHPPVDTDHFTPGAEREDFFLYVGRLVAYKRADVVVRAFGGLRQRLVVVGTGHMERELRSIATRNVTFERDVSGDRLRELYRRARALVYPCEEDFGIVMAEALACGTPVIGLRAGGALDIVEEGFSGRLVDRADPRCVADAVEDVAASEFDHSAISRSAQRFSGARYRQEMRRIAEEVVGAPGARIPPPIRPSADRALQ